MMTWPDVLQVLALIAGGAATVAGLAWTLGRIFRPWMREASGEACDALYERLKSNDFRHMEDRIASGLEGVSARLDSMDARLDRMNSRLAASDARADARLDRFEKRILEAVRSKPGPERPPQG